MKNLQWLLLSSIIIFVDYVSKLLVSKYLPLYESIPIFPFFNVTLTHNTGAAFSLLGAANGWQRWFFVAIAVLASIFCIMWLYRLPPRNRSTCLAISLILGGALGNLWDRLYFGYVVDFIDFYVNDWHWPIFNVADTAICIGAAILVIFSFSKQEK